MHNGPTTCLAFDHLGRLYSGSYDCQVIAWNATLDDVRWNARHDGLVNGITATESLLLSVGADRLVRAWDLDSGGEKTKSFAPRVDDLNIIRVSADQSLIVASGDEGKICVYDASDTKLRWERQSCLPQTFGESIEAMDLVQLPNGEEAIIAGDGSGNVVLLDIDGQIIDRARLPGTAECCCYSPWDRSVVFGLADGSIISLAIAGLEVKAARREHRSTVKAVAASEDGHIASASYDGTLILWHGGSLEQLERVRLTAPNARGWARGLAFNPHRPSELAVTALDARPFIRDMSSKQVISGSGRRTSGVNALATRHNRIFAGCDDGKIWVATAAEARPFAQSDEMVLCLAMHPTAYVLAVGRHDGTTDLVDISNGSVICAMAGDGTPAVSALFDPTGGRLYVGHYSGALRVFDYPSGKLVHELTVADAIKVLCSMGRSTRLALGIADGSLMVLDTVSYRLVGRRDDLFLVNGLAWLTGSDELVSVSRDLFVRRWSADLDLLGEVTAHSRSIKVICASPDGRHWATAGYDAEVMIWSHNGLVARCKGHDLPGVAALSWLDSRTLVSGGWDCTLKVWDIAGECHGTVSLDERKEGLRHDIVHIAVDEPAGRFAEPRTAGVLR